MPLQFVDTNIFIYANDNSAGSKHIRARSLLTELALSDSGAISIQVLAEFYAVSTAKLRIPKSIVDVMLEELSIWTLHRPAYVDVIQSIQIHRRLKLSWWDSLLVNSALELGCTTLWTEDLTDGQRIGKLTVRNPFA